MKSSYFTYLGAAFLLCCLVPVGAFYFSLKSTTHSTEIKTSYEFEEVAGPIQPIPRVLNIDKNWLGVGKALFHSPLLSKDNTISCASCHLVDFGGDDGFPVSTGVNNKKGVRNSPTVLNAVFNFRQFWDGRAGSLAEQISGPIHNPVEMGTAWADIVTKLNNDSYFKKAFAGLSPLGITEDNIIKALTIYEESLITPNAPIDQYLLGDDQALNVQQKRGLRLFNSYGCSTCHQGRNIGGNIFQKLGRVNKIPVALTLDDGKYQVTQQEKDRYIFKVPSLRNIAQTAPYFHNGSVDTLPEAVRIMASTQLGVELTDNEVDDIVALLHAFSAKVIEVN